MALDDAAEFDKRRMRREALRHKRQQQQKKLIISLVIAGVVLIACGVLIFLLSRGSQPQETEPPAEDTQPTQQTQSTQPATEPEETQPPVDNTVINITIGGDMNVTDKTVSSGGLSYDYSRVFLDVLPLLAQADLTIVNFEGNLCGAPYGTETRSAPQKLADALVTSGVDMVQMANSCAIVNGIIGLNDTLSNLRRAGLEPIGAYANASEFNKSGGYVIKDLGGVKVALVAFTKGMDGMALPTGSEQCVNLLYTDYATTYQKVDRDRINSILKRVEREAPDITIALVHWGSEYNDNRSDAQEDVRDVLLEAGVDVIVGTHSHYVQSLEYDEETGTLVAYSLGDFFSDAQRSGTEYSILLHLEITKDNISGMTTLSNYSYTPLFTIGEEGNHRVVRLDDAIKAYENSYVESVTKATYEDMLYARSRIEERVKPLVEEEE